MDLCVRAQNDAGKINIPREHENKSNLYLVEKHAYVINAIN